LDWKYRFSQIMRDLVEGYQKPNLHSSTFARAGSSVRHWNKDVTCIWIKCSVLKVCSV